MAALLGEMNIFVMKESQLDNEIKLGAQCCVINKIRITTGLVSGTRNTLPTITKVKRLKKTPPQYRSVFYSRVRRSAQRRGSTPVFNKKQFANTTTALFPPDK